MKWVGISGGWRKTNKYVEEYKEIEKKVREACENLIARLSELKKRGIWALIIEDTDADFNEETKLGLYYKRNSRVIDASDELIAFPIKTEASDSLGTNDTIQKARAKGILVKVFSYDLTK